MAVSSLKMFFTRFGGKDLPIASNWFDKFGFESTLVEEENRYINYTNPIYKHSIADIIKNFESPLMFTTENQMNNNRAISDFTIIETQDNIEARNIIITSPFWKKVLNLIELIYENQSEWLNPPVNSTPSDDFGPYSCRGDELLRDRTNPAFTNVANIYQGGSLKCYYTAGSNRIHTCELNVTNSALSSDEKNVDGTTIAQNIYIKIYFNPDEYIVAGATTNYAIYTYEDLTGDFEIDDVEKLYNVEGKDGLTTEFDASIVDKLSKILIDGKYKRYIRYCPTGGILGSTFYINKGVIDQNSAIPQLISESGENGVLIESSNMQEYGYNKPFYIFTSLDDSQEIDDTTILRYVREYVETVLYPGDENAVERILRFPNLFTNIEISVYPMFNNYNSDNEIKFGINNTAIRDFCSRIGNPDQYEIFYVGTAINSTHNGEFINLPLIAVEGTISSNSYSPISSRFKKYRPIYSTTDQYYENLDGKTVVFHELCVLALSILSGKLHISDLQGDIPETIIFNGEEFTLINEGVQFREIEAGYDPSIDGYVNHSVLFNYNNVTYKFIDVIGSGD